MSEKPICATRVIDGELYIATHNFPGGTERVMQILEEERKKVAEDTLHRMVGASVGAAGVDQVPGGVALIAKERKRQIEKEGWTAAHDDEHREGQLSEAAACYALVAGSQIRGAGADELRDTFFEWNDSLLDWPFEKSWFKPSEYALRNLEKAGALIAAEIDRLKRTTGKTPSSVEVQPGADTSHSGSPALGPQARSGEESELPESVQSFFIETYTKMQDASDKSLDDPLSSGHHEWKSACNQFHVASVMVAAHMKANRRTDDGERSEHRGPNTMLNGEA